MTISLDSLSFSSMTEGSTEDVIKHLREWSEKANKKQLLLTIKFVGHYVSEVGSWASREQKARFIVDVSNGFSVEQINPISGLSSCMTEAEGAAHKLIIGKIKVVAQGVADNLSTQTGLVRGKFVYNPCNIRAMNGMAHHIAPTLNFKKKS